MRLHQFSPPLVFLWCFSTEQVKKNHSEPQVCVGERVYLGVLWGLEQTLVDRGQREQVLESKVQGGGEMGWGSWAIPELGSVSDLLGVLNPHSSGITGGEER